MICPKCGTELNNEMFCQNCYYLLYDENIITLRNNFLNRNNQIHINLSPSNNQLDGENEDENFSNRCID